MSDEWSNYWDYAYDTLGQVTSGRKFRSDGVAFTGQHHQYVHDAIGNRTSTTTNGRAASYTSNAANQYTSRAVPDGVDIFGTAHPDATVTVNHLATTRQNDYFYRLLNFPNTTAARWEAVTVRADLNGILTQTTGNIFLPRTPESYTYDWDGNLLTDGRFTYTYDGENRLTRMETRTGLPTGLQRQRIDFRYDAFGRRFLKIVFNWTGSVWAEVSRERYYYDGWHLAGRQGTSGGQATGQFYLWGTDVSGTMQGAGGVGGLLLVHDVPTGKYYHPTSDANGNVIALWDAATGLLSAQYEYDPFGQTTRAVGVTADVNPFRFSTKFLDHETGLYYYGYRYYQPGTGRWLNRDPIEERGGLNLYAMVGNDAVNFLDYLGLSAQGRRCTWRLYVAHGRDNWRRFKGQGRSRCGDRIGYVGCGMNNLNERLSKPIAWPVTINPPALPDVPGGLDGEMVRNPDNNPHFFDPLDSNDPDRPRDWDGVIDIYDNTQMPTLIKQAWEG
jgi:RHS repeat-associated protein